MKQGIWPVLSVIVVLVALGLGFFGGQLWKGSSVDKDQLSDLRKRVEALEKTSGSSSGFKIAYVDMFKVLQELRESPLVKSSLEQFQEEQRKITQQKEEWTKKFQQGEISKKQLDEKLTELDLKLQEINLQLSAPIQKEMLQVIRQIGQEKGYSLVIDNPASQLNAVVLYSQAGQADDITQEVISRLSAQLDQKKDESK